MIAINDIPNTISKEAQAQIIMRSLLDMHKMIAPDLRLYQAGGSLLPHPTKDYDLVIWDRGAMWDEAMIKRFWENNYSRIGFTSCEIYMRDDAGCEYDMEDEGKLGVVKLVKDGISYDLLYADVQKRHLSLMHWMREYFPLSCQCVAVDISDSSTIGDVQVDRIIAYQIGDALEKYAGYYPDAVFYLLSSKGAYIQGKDLLK